MLNCSARAPRLKLKLSAYEEHALYQHYDNAIKEKDAQVHVLQHELSRMQEKQRIQLEAERFEAERVAASAQVFADGPSTERYSTPVDKVAIVANLAYTHSPGMSLGASAGNVNLKTRTASQAMVIIARKRIGMKTTPQPEAKAEAKAVSCPARRMRSKGPLRTKVHDLLHAQEEIPLITRLAKHNLLTDKHVVQEDYHAPPDFQCVTIQAVPQATLEMMVEEEMDLKSLMMAPLLTLITMGDHLTSLLEIQIQMVITIEMHDCTSL